MVEQFVSGHNGSDVLRELVQNEFDGDGDRLAVTFGDSALEVVGNGKGITPEGWTRLSVIVGTGRVVGDHHGERVLPKANGIGSKNFGLRSLFLFGDEIYVRSGGQVCVLDLRTLETGKVPDPHWWGGRGVRIQVPFRQEAFEMLEPFTAEREAAAFDIMANGMLATLVKLALPGRRTGLRELTLRSARGKRSLEWKQNAETLRSPMKGVSVVRRVGRLIDSGGGTSARRDFEEIEFTTAVQVPVDYSDHPHPAYFRSKSGAIKIGISLPIARKQLDQRRVGHFHYPLQAPDARTGCLVGVSAPFALDNDRSSITDHGWNHWLMDEAARFAVELLTGDWFDRLGPSAFQALVRIETATPSRFIDAVSKSLKERKCWPTQGTGEARFAKASDTVIVSDPLLDSFLPENSYLDRSLSANPSVREFAISFGATEFTPSSLVRLRCAGEDSRHLQTKLKAGETNLRYADHQGSLQVLDRQIKMASSLSALAKRLTPSNRIDLRSSTSTLSATGELHAAEDLVMVPTEIWDICPEPMQHRLHRDLLSHRAISGLCRPFDEQAWMVEAADRAVKGTIGIAERSALYVRIIDEETHLGRQATQAIRKSPVTKSHRGEWVAPESMVVLKGKLARFMAPVVQTPSKEMMQVKGLLLKLRIREHLSTEDLLAYAKQISDRPSTAEAFEQLLSENIRLLTPSARKELARIEFLRSKAGSLAAPQSLHLDTAANRLVVSRDEELVAGTNEPLYRRLDVAENPSVDTLLAVVEGLRNKSERPARPEAIYPAIVASLKREGRARREFEDRPIIWWNGDFHAPSEILIGASIPKVLDHAVPVLRRLDEATIAYLSLGARSQPSDDDWRRFFRKVYEDWDRENLPQHTRRLLLDAYHIRGHDGLPSGLDTLECLLCRTGILYSLEELRRGLVFENDFPALANALAAANVQLGVIDVVEKNRPFFHRLGIPPLSGIAGTGIPVLGNAVHSPIWFKPYHNDNLMIMVRRPIFARALHAVALRRRHMFDGFSPVPLDQLANRLGELKGVTFHDQILREYSVGAAVASIPVEAAIGDGVIGLVAPRTRLDFQQLVAQALAEITGAANAALARTLSTDFLPLVLCRSVEEILVWLERIGIDPRGWDQEDEPELNLDNIGTDEIGEEAIRQVMNALSTTSEHDAPPPFNTTSVAIPVDSTATTTIIYTPPPLPALETVNLVVATASDKIVEPHLVQSNGGYGYGGWNPRTGAQVDRDHEIGKHGEELVYRMELERVRNSGHPNPEEVVIWTSLNDPGADHDICSVDELGRPRWIEVKSTTGIDGRFEWPKKEFEKAMRERDRYELWRVYRTGSAEPVAKCFPNPSKLLGVSRLQLELGTLRAIVEGID